MRRSVCGAVLAGALLAATGAHAHAHLLSSYPAEGATVASPAAITLTFSEVPTPKFSGLTLSDPRGRPIALAPRLAPAAKAMSAALKAKLEPGLYTVSWHAVSADTHRVQGRYVFKVK